MIAVIFEMLLAPVDTNVVPAAKAGVNPVPIDPALSVTVDPPTVVNWALAVVPVPVMAPPSVKVPVPNFRSPADTVPPVRCTVPALTLHAVDNVPKSIFAPLLEATELPTNAISPLTVSVPVAPEVQVMLDTPVEVDADETIEPAVKLPVPCMTMDWPLAVALAVNVSAPVIVNVLPVAIVKLLAAVGEAMVRLVTVGLTSTVTLWPLAIETVSTG